MYIVCVYYIYKLKRNINYHVCLIPEYRTTLLFEKYIFAPITRLSNNSTEKAKPQTLIIN